MNENDNTSAALAFFEKHLELLRADLHEIRDRLDNYETRITRVEVKAGVWGTLGGLLAGLAAAVMAIWRN